jgi:DNA-binding NarL/FixJ family response regulator
MNKPKKIVIVEDNFEIRTGFQFLINSTSEFVVEQTFESCEDAISNIKSINPDIILMDIDLPGINGIEGTRKIKNIFPKVDIIIVTIFENSNHVFEALSAGAVGYLTKNNNHAQLLAALHEISNGGAPMSANIARMVAQSFFKSKNDFLTPKESEILHELVNGKSYKSISNNLSITVDTVKFHIKNIYIKLQVSNKEDAIQIAKHKNLV